MNNRIHTHTHTNTINNRIHTYKIKIHKLKSHVKEQKNQKKTDSRYGMNRLSYYINSREMSLNLFQMFA